LASLEISGHDLTLRDIAKVARQNYPIALSGRARQQLLQSRDTVTQALSEGRTIYGVNTGFGKLADVRIDPDKARELQVNLVRSHACGLGTPLAKDVVRAMMLIRVNTLAKGYSGIRPEIVEALIQVLNKGVTPVIPSQGSVGASGDLAPAAHLALVLIGEGSADYRGQVLPGMLALLKAGIRAVSFEPKDGLAILNGTHACSALACIGLVEMENLILTAEVAGSLSLEALKGTRTAFDFRIHNVRPHPGQIESARTLASLTRDSEIIASHKDCKKVQDAYSLRCMPQVHGSARTAWQHALQVAETEINSATDNPLVFSDEPQVVSGGNFHGEPIALILDYLAIALTEIGNISERRIERLVNPDLSELPPFLTSQPGLESGFMMNQVAAAALASENKVYSHPASVDSIPTEANMEDHVSMAMHAGLKLFSIVENVKNIIAIELMCAAQGIDFLAPLKPGWGTGRAYERIRQDVPSLVRDRSTSGDVRRIVEKINAGEFQQIAREALA
jgi:histidine ammonia-lyase